MSSAAQGKILIVDDNPHNLAAFSAMLEPLGAELLTAASGEDALRAVLREDLALILLDVRMPGLDGYETARLIRGRQRSRHIPVIFLTAAEEGEHYVVRGYALGAVDFIVKPVNADILRSKVTVFLELHHRGEIIRGQAEQLRRATEQKLVDYQRWSEARYSSLADAVPDLVWTADAQGALTFRNRRWQECRGSSSADLAFSAIVHPDDWPAFNAGYAEAISQVRAWQVQVRLGNPDTGAFRWHLVRMLPSLAQPDGSLGWVGISADVDDQKRAQQALEMLASVTRRLGELWDGERALEDVLKLSLPVLGDAAILDLTQVVGAPRRLAVAHPDTHTPELDDPRFDFAPSSVAFTGHSEIQLEVSNDDGSTLLGFLNELGVRSYLCLPLFSRDKIMGSITFFTAGSLRRYAPADVALAEDVARRLATALENLQLYEIAERDRRRSVEEGHAKDVFLATLSHELRTPLNAIVGWAHLAKTGQLSQDQSQRAVDTIDRNARALAKLVADLVDVSRIVAGNFKVDSKVVDFRQVVELAVEAARPSAGASELELQLEASGDRTSVVGDPARLQQVVGNAIGNAVKFTPKGGKITLRLEAEESDLVLRVSDTGQGIAPEFLPFVFEPFRQERRSHARSQEGLGLGLAIVKHLVELHGGSVCAESEGLGKGTTLCVRLPLAPPDSAQSSLPSPASRPHLHSADDTGRKPPPLLAGVHALLVEDDPDGCELVETLLRGLGATVSVAGTARDAWAKLHDHPPDVLVSDIGLPDEDGLSLIRRVRQNAALAQLPAVALTAYASKRDVAQALAAGFHAHLAKPVEPRELGATIARVSGRATIH